PDAAASPASILFSFVSPLSLFFFNDTATTEISPLSLHDALPIWRRASAGRRRRDMPAREHPSRRRALRRPGHCRATIAFPAVERSEEHTSELQSLTNLVCRLLLEKKKQKVQRRTTDTTQIQCSLT